MALHEVARGGEQPGNNTFKPCRQLRIGDYIAMAEIITGGKPSYCGRGSTELGRNTDSFQVPLAAGSSFIAFEDPYGERSYFLLMGKNRPGNPVIYLDDSVVAIRSGSRESMGMVQFVLPLEVNAGLETVKSITISSGRAYTISERKACEEQVVAAAVMARDLADSRV